MNILNINFIIVLLGLFSNGDVDIAAYNYIEEHKELAIIEMYRSGIPASITMAQALHESNFGKSDLATKANNHFGIKCKSYWKGTTYQHKDDDYKNGKLIKSCFRSYSSVFDSYIDHSNFLKGTSHYKHLFKLNKNDYKAWAVGLQKSGYATDPKYSEKLVKFIEKYGLDKLDYEEDPYQVLTKKLQR